MGTLWIVTANSGFAKIFEVKGHGRQITEIQHIDFPNGRLKSSEVNSDRPGRSFDSVGSGRHAHSPAVSVHVHENKVFARQIADLLQAAHTNPSPSFDELALIAPPHFLGELKLAISNGVKKCIIKEIPKDLPEYLSDKERIDHLCNYLELWNRTSATPN
ncbi:MAG: host attachment protein [Parachlamydiaceae bacterium]|nr:host attachment protein [Parachlamydiaceae bacterium]